ncbi:hypothetical protein JZ751_023586 [Albula glossodonta]|uniref:Protein CMSS1 n=1 Tax=Albula glossodonta TaxID=121402 RepID=A0A8T2NGR4_9TELE|nr:hypothetical protein JZ751_023586 [Albula glossodonta]
MALARRGGWGASEEEEEQEKPAENVPEDKKAKKRKSESQSVKQTKAKKKKKTPQKECFVAKEKKDDGEDNDSKKPKKRRKKKKITDVLASSEPKPGKPADLQKLILDHYSGKRSVIEIEELKLPDSCFLTSNDLTHSLSSYLKEICPKWAKAQKQHTVKKSLALLIVCSSALRAIELIKQLTTFKGEAKVVKLFAKHIKKNERDYLAVLGE